MSIYVLGRCDCAQSSRDQSLGPAQPNAFGLVSVQYIIKRMPKKSLGCMYSWWCDMDGSNH